MEKFFILFQVSIQKLKILQATLNFNPAAMLPGAAPPVKEPEPVEIGFDVPPEAKTLSSANKVGRRSNSEHVANKVSSTVENMIKEK